MKLVISLVMLFIFTISCQKNTKSNIQPKDIKDQEQVEVIDCKQTIVQAQHLMGNEVIAEDFSTLSPENFKISKDEFNRLPITEQRRLYRQMKPLVMFVRETISELDSTIDQAANNIWGIVLEGQIEDYKKFSKTLKEHCLK